MVYLTNFRNNNFNVGRNVSFKKEEEPEQVESAKLLYKEQRDNPISTKLKIEGTKLLNTFTTYPAKGLGASKNSNFHEFLEMGEKIAFPLGCITMMAIPNVVSKHYDLTSGEFAAKAGRPMAFGVAFYAGAKYLSKYLTEEPLNLKYGIDVNQYYKKKINELPEERNLPKPSDDDVFTEDGQKPKGNLVAYEYHKVYESVDFPYWDLFHDNPDIGEGRNAYYDEVARKMGYSDDELEYSDQKVKPLIREKLVQTKFFSTMTSYLFAAIGVGMANQKAMEELPLPKKTQLKKPKEMFNYTKGFVKSIGRSFKQFIGTEKMGTLDYVVKKCKNEAIDVAKAPTTANLVGRGLVAAAVGTTLLGNYVVLRNVNKDKGNINAASSLIDDNKEKVVC